MAATSAPPGVETRSNDNCRRAPARDAPNSGLEVVPAAYVDPAVVGDSCGLRSVTEPARSGPRAVGRRVGRAPCGPACNVSVPGARLRYPRRQNAWCSQATHFHPLVLGFGPQAPHWPALAELLELGIILILIRRSCSSSCSWLARLSQWGLADEVSSIRHDLRKYVGIPRGHADLGMAKDLHHDALINTLGR
jgi:hypothetical protein